MQLPGNLLLVHRIVACILYTLMKLVFTAVQRICWELNGTARKLREARLEHNYARSAQVLNPVYFHIFSSLYPLSLWNFLYTHNRFENPQYIIDNDNITLMRVTDHDAVFCEAEEKGKHII